MNEKKNETGTGEYAIPMGSGDNRNDELQSQIKGEKRKTPVECEDDQHELVMTDEYIDCTRFICACCGKVVYKSKLLPEDGSASTQNGPIPAYLAKYTWDLATMCADAITEFSVTFGDFPIITITCSERALHIKKSINGSRDDRLELPRGALDDEDLLLTETQAENLFAFIKQIDFSKWITDRRTIENEEVLHPCGFSVDSRFTCSFKNGAVFTCLFPKEEPFFVLVSMLKLLCGDKVENQYDHLLSDESAEEPMGQFTPGNTTELFPDTLRLTLECTGKTVMIRKMLVRVGRDNSADLAFEDVKEISPCHAYFLYENRSWYLQDDNSANGTWLNDSRLAPGKKYELVANDLISFAGKETVTFYKSEQEPLFAYDAEDSEENKLVILRETMTQFSKSGEKDEKALETIFALLPQVPLYIPMGMDMEAVIATKDAWQQKPGDSMQNMRDAGMRFLTAVFENDIRLVLLFTSEEEANKGPSVPLIRLSLQAYLPRLIAMDLDALLDPFSENRFVLPKLMMRSILLPSVREDVPTRLPAEPTAPESLIGKTIADKYEIIRRTGGSDTCTNYLAKEIRINKYRIMKIGHKKSTQYSPYMRQFLLEEAAKVRDLSHPAIPKAVDIIETESYICVAWEYVPGDTLETLVQKNGPQPVDRVIDWGRQLCDVLSYLHRQKPPRIYRDMRPYNVILTADGTLKLADCDVMRTYKPGKRGDTCMLGTRGYAAPEQFGSMGQTDARTDIYALGVTMHRLVTGVDPSGPLFDLEPIRSYDPRLPEGLEYIISKCTQRNPADRYQTCAQLLADLNQYTSLPKPKGFFSSLFGRK